MKKSTEYGFGGAAFLTGGLNMAIAPLLVGGFGAMSLGVLWFSVPVAVALGSIGAYWLVKAQGFYVAERQLPIGLVTTP
jgi:hypothetical protein